MQNEIPYDFLQNLDPSLRDISITLSKPDVDVDVDPHLDSDIQNAYGTYAHTMVPNLLPAYHSFPLDQLYYEPEPEPEPKEEATHQFPFPLVQNQKMALEGQSDLSFLSTTSGSPRSTNSTSNYNYHSPSRPPPEITITTSEGPTLEPPLVLPMSVVLPPFSFPPPVPLSLPLSVPVPVPVPVSVLGGEELSLRSEDDADESITTDPNPGPSQDATPPKYDEPEATAIPTPPASQTASASSTPAKPKGSHKKVKQAEYTVPVKQVPQYPWKLEPTSVRPVAASDLTLMFSRNSPHIWAETTEDLLCTLQTYPDIFKTDGIGMEGTCINHLIFSGKPWQNIEWINPYVFVLKRVWKFKNTKKRALKTKTSTSKASKIRKTVRFDDDTDSNILEAVGLDGDGNGNGKLEDASSSTSVSANVTQAVAHHHPSLTRLDKNDVVNGHSNNHQQSIGAHQVDLTVAPANSDVPGFDLKTHSNSTGLDHAPPSPPPPAISIVNTENGMVLQDSYDEAVLPREALLFQIALQSRHPISIFCANDLLPEFKLSEKDSDSESRSRLLGLEASSYYAFMGFFIVTGVEKIFSISENQGEGSSELIVTFEWVRNGAICRPLNQSLPWWISSSESGTAATNVLTTTNSNIDDSDRAMCLNLTCFSHISVYPKEEPGVQVVNVSVNSAFLNGNGYAGEGDEDEDEDEDDAGFDAVHENDQVEEICSADSSSCWLCRLCGKLNAVVPFRMRWSWSCRHCKTVGRLIQNIHFQPIIFQEAYHLSPPLPLKDDNSPFDHRISSFKYSEQAIIYRFNKPSSSHDIELRHIPSVDDEDQTQQELESLFYSIQRKIDFVPCHKDKDQDQDPSLLEFCYSLNGAADSDRDGDARNSAGDNDDMDVSFLIKAFDRFIKDRPGLVDVLPIRPKFEGLRCAFWPNKGSTKSLSLKDRHIIFITVGSSCEFRFTVTPHRNQSGQRGRPKSYNLTLSMPHCAVLVFRRGDDEEATVTYKIFRTGRLLLLSRYWN